MAEIKAPFYSYEDLRKKADEFLAAYHASKIIPVPIEEIVDLKFGINIVPSLGLQREFEIDGFTSIDSKSMYIDEYVYDYNSNRFRYTLAHEIAHVFLHDKLIQMANYSDPHEWKEFINSIPDKEHRWFEYQAYAFAGLVLVPRQNLLMQTEASIKLISDEGISLEDNWDFAWEIIGDHLSKLFEVSSSVIEKRLMKDEIQKKYV